MLTNQEIKEAVTEGLKRAIYKRVARHLTQDRGLQDILDAHVSSMCLTWKMNIDRNRHTVKANQDSPADAGYWVANELVIVSEKRRGVHHGISRF